MSHSSRQSLTHKGIIGVIGLLFFGSGAVLAGNYAIQDYNTVFTVNEVRISKSDVARRSLQLQPFFRDAKIAAKDQETYVHNELVERELLLQAAEKAGLSITEADIDTEWQQLLSAQYNGDQEAFERDLKRSSYTSRLFRQELADRLLVRQMRKRIQQPVKVSEADLQNYYAAHQSDYQAPERISAQHILIHIDENTPNGEVLAQQKAQRVLKELQQGKTFSELAKTYSDDSTNHEEGGQLPLFTRGEMVPAFESAVWPMKPGEVSKQPVKTEFGYHIIRRGSTLPAGPKPFEEARSAFEARLQADAEEKAIQDWLAQQKQEAKIQPPLD